MLQALELVPSLSRLLSSPLRRPRSGRIWSGTARTSSGFSEGPHSPFNSLSLIPCFFAVTYPLQAHPKEHYENLLKSNMRSIYPPYAEFPQLPRLKEHLEVEWEAKGRQNRREEKEAPAAGS